MDKKPIQFSCQIDSVRANSDRTLSIKLGTQELQPDETAVIFSLMEKQIWCALAETSITKEDLNIPETVSDMDTKSPSQRLRDRMAAYYKQTHGKFDGFDDWYKTALEKIGEKYLEKLS